MNDYEEIARYTHTQTSTIQYLTVNSIYRVKINDLFNALV